MQLTQKEIITDCMLSTDEYVDSDAEQDTKKTSPIVTKTFEHETKKGMLTYRVEIIETTDEECGITIHISYESYTDGAAYFTIYKPDDIPAIHKLFNLDPTMILDMISDNSLIVDIKINSKVVSVHYMTTLMKRKYNITLECLRVTHEGQDPAIGDLQRQNKILLRQVSMLTNRLDEMDKKVDKLLKVDVKVVYHSASTPPIRITKDKTTGRFVHKITGLVINKANRKVTCVQLDNGDTRPLTVEDVEVASLYSLKIDPDVEIEEEGSDLELELEAKK